MNGFGFSRRWRSLLQFVGLFSLCIALIVACGSPQSSTPTNTADPANSGAAAGGRVTMGTTLKARTVDPADAYEIFPGILLYNMGDRLYTYAPGTTDLVPQLATEMPTVSDDGLTYTIPMREGVTFHDGSPVTAEAMAFSIQRFMENGGRPAFLLSDIVESAEATGDLELTIKLKSPFSAFPSLLTFWGITPIPVDAYEIGAGQFKPDSFIGTGPYKLASFGTDSIRLDVNENYWGDKPANQGIDIQLFSSSANLYNTFRTGGLDIAYQTLDPDQIVSLKNEAPNGGWEVIEAGTTVINYITLNQKIKPLDDVNVRKAIASMIDRNLLNERVFQGNALPLYSVLPASFPTYKPVFKDAYGDGDFEKAKAFLAEAGFSESNPFTLELWYPSASTTRNLVSSALKASIERGLPGIVTVDVKNVEGATLFENVEKGIYPAVLLNWYPDFYDADNFVTPLMSCDQGSAETLCEKGATQGNGSFYYSDRTSQLIKQQRAEQDPEARNSEINELQDLLAEDVPIIPLWQEKDYVFAKGGLEGVSIEPTQQLLLWQIQK